MDKLCSLGSLVSFIPTNLHYLYDKLSKGVSILSDQLPYSLKLVKSYPIISNSKAAKGLLVYLEVSCICTAIIISTEPIIETAVVS